MKRIVYYDDGSFVEDPLQDIVVNAIHDLENGQSISICVAPFYPTFPDSFGGLSILPSLFDGERYLMRFEYLSCKVYDYACDRTLMESNDKRASEKLKFPDLYNRHMYLERKYTIPNKQEVLQIVAYYWKYGALPPDVPIYTVDYSRKLRDLVPTRKHYVIIVILTGLFFLGYWITGEIGGGMALAMIIPGLYGILADSLHSRK